jgi:hypothetical protein
MELVSRSANPHEFTDLCYLLTCKNVHDVQSFQVRQ